MRKAALCLMMSLLLVLTLATAGAETLTPQYYDPANDMPSWVSEVYDLTDEELQALRHGYPSFSLLPLSDGNLLLYGSFEYEDLYMEESHNLGFDEKMPRTDAYAVAINPNGQRLWHLRISDPEAQNGFEQAWLMDDGRILMKYGNYIGEWKSQYYIVSQASEVQEMLPAYKTKVDGTYETLVPMHGGYFGGGQYVTDAYSPMTREVNLTYYDAELNQRWRIEDKNLIGASLFSIIPSESGILLGGSQSYIEDPDQWTMMPAPIALHIGLDGSVIWQYTGHEYAIAAADNLCLAADGGVLFTSNVDPTVATPREVAYAAILTKLNADGQHVWTRDYLEDQGLAYFLDMVPYQGGLLACGSPDDYQSMAVLHLDQDGEVLDRIDLDLLPCNYLWGALAVSETGEAYVYGTLASYDVNENGSSENYSSTMFFVPVKGGES